MLEARQADDLDRAFRAMRDARAEALSLIAIGIMSSHRQLIAQMALEAKIPAIYSNTDLVVEGGLMAYAPDLPDQFARAAAVFVDKILKGAKPADLPVEQPTKFELAINMKTAKALGITFPQSILVRASQVIQ